MTSDVFFTISELAKRWRVSRHTVTGLIQRGELQAFRAGARAFRIREDEVNRYEQQNMGKGAA